MPLAALKPSILASKWSLIHTLDHTAIGIGSLNQLTHNLFHFTLICKAFCKFYFKVVLLHGCKNLYFCMVATVVLPP